MRNRITRILLALVLGLSVAVPAFIAGVWVGADQLLLLDSTPRAALLVGELRALREGKTHELILAKELELDGQVLQYARSQQHGAAWLFWPLGESVNTERHLKLLAQYRTEHPSIFPKGTPSAGQHQGEAESLLHATTRDIVLRHAK